MKKHMLKSAGLILALCTMLFANTRARAQVLLTVDPTQNWIGYMNVFTLPPGSGTGSGSQSGTPVGPLGGGYEFGSSWGTAALQAAFSGNLLIIQPCTNVWSTSGTYWVQADGETPNDIMDANFYVQNDGLTDTNIVFVGTCATNTLNGMVEARTGVYYTNFAFIKIFDGSYNEIGSITTNLAPGQPFSLSYNTLGASHVQYGFETIGPDANPATYTNLGETVIQVTPPSAEVTTDPSKTWVGYMNVYNLPSAGGGYDYGSAWGTGALTADFIDTNSLVISPCTNVWETSDTYYVQADGQTPNKIMDASMYVQNDALVNSNVIFFGTCDTNTLTESPEPLTGIYYTSVAFIKAFNSSYGVIAEATNALIQGQTFGLTLNTAGAAHVQYGFETVGPDANPATVSGLGDVAIAAIPSPQTIVLQKPTNAAPTPKLPASSVLALYDSSGVYPIHHVERWLAGWSVSGGGSYTIPATTSTVLEYTGLQYAGVEFYDTNNGDNVGGAVNYSVNATNYDGFHVDVWTPNANQLGIEIVSLDPTVGPDVVYTPASGVITNNHWISLNIPMSTFVNLAQQSGGTLETNDLQQMLFIDNQSGGVTGGTFYIDNVYFYQTTPSASVSGGQISLSFPTAVGESYAVLYKNNLTDSTWQTLTSVNGTGSNVTVTDSAGLTSRFYKLSWSPTP